MQVLEQLNEHKRLALSGLDRLLSDNETIAGLAKRQVGLLTNHACTTCEGAPASRALNNKLSDAGGGPIRLFTPEHGIQLSMRAGAAVNHGLDPLTGLPVYSLYKHGRLDDDATFGHIETLVIDLRDVGVRCYTYAATAAQAAQKALEQNIDVIVCDRANPLGPGAEGPCPESERRSLLAYFDIPFVHGHTIAELLATCITHGKDDASYLVYPADIAGRAGLGWIPPSPALSHPDAVAAYAGLVLLEATNISEGRGSSAAFRSVSAPNLDVLSLTAALYKWNTGFVAAPAVITSMRGGQAGQSLPGIQIWPQRNMRQKPLSLGIHLLAWLRREYPNFAWLPLQSNESGAAIDNLFGHSALREKLEDGISPDDIMAAWR
jgi:uncharacterized protein YbbC (DUF1343 family)